MKRLSALARRTAFVVGGLLVAQLSPQSATAGLPEHIWKVHEPGIDPEHLSIADVNEAIDTFSGGLQLSYVDLHLPGKGGLDLTVMRSFSSKFRPWHENRPDGSPATDSVIGLGWVLRVAPEINWNQIDDYIEAHLADGSVMGLVWEPASETYVSSSLWRVKRRGTSTTSEDEFSFDLFAPNGVIYHYDSTQMRIEEWILTPTISIVQPLYVPQTIRDLTGNEIQLMWDDVYDYYTLDLGAMGPARKGRLRSVEDTYERIVEFRYDQSDVIRSGWLHPPKLTDILVSDNGPTRQYGVRHFAGTPQLNYLETASDGQFTTAYRHRADRLLEQIDQPGGSTVTYAWDTEQKYQIGSEVSVFLQTYCVTERTLTHDGVADVTVYDYPDYPQRNNRRDDRTAVDVLANNQTVTRTEYFHLGYHDAPFSESRHLGRLEKIVRHEGRNSALEETRYLHEANEVGPPGTDNRYPTEPLKLDRWREEVVERNRVPVLTSTWRDFDDYGQPREIRVQGRGVDLTTTLTYHAIDDIPNDRYHITGLVASSRQSGDPGALETTVFDDFGRPTEIVVHADPSAPAVGDEDHKTTIAYHVEAPPACRGGPGPLQSCRGEVRSVTAHGAGTTPNRTVHFPKWHYGGPAQQRDDRDPVDGGVLRTFLVDGSLAATTDRNGQTSDYTYWPSGIVRTIVDPDGVVRRVTPDIRPSSRKLTVETFATLGSTTALTSTVHYYDQALRLVATETETGDLPPRDIVRTRQSYDGLGRLWRRYDPSYTASGGAFRQYTYDGLHRVTEERFCMQSPCAAPQITRTSYTGVDATVQDPKGRTRRLSFDALGHLVAVRGPGTAQIGYAYNSHGALASVTQDGIRARTLTHDALGQLVAESHPETGEIAYQYDRFGQIETRTNADVTKVWAYDSIGRPTSIRYGATSPAAITWTYDDNGGCASNCWDRLARVATDASTIDYRSYDRVGRLVTKHVTLKDPLTATVDHQFDVAYTHDTLGRLESLTLPSGRILRYAWDKLGRMRSLTDERTTTRSILADVTYSATSRPERMRYFPRGGSAFTDQTHQYDGKSRPSQLTLTSNGPGTLLDIDYTAYDLADNLETTVVDGQTQRFRYDDQDRLTEASYGPFGDDGRLTYRYDDAGNRTGFTGTGTMGAPLGTWSVTPNERNRHPGWTYDGRGNVTGDGSHTYTYTETNLLRSVDGQVTYHYNGVGERIRRTDASGDTYLYHWENGVPVTIWRLGPDEPEAQDNDETNAIALHLDALGTVRARTDGRTGELIELPRRGPFGEPLGSAEATGWGITGFQGKSLDPASDLWAFGARDYNWRTARFLSVDPAGDHSLVVPFTWNRYAFARHNPMRFADPSGEAGKDIADWLDARANYAVDYYRQQSSGSFGDVTIDAFTSTGADLAKGFYDFLHLGEGLYNSYEAAENGDYLSAVLFAGQDVLRGFQIVSFGVSARSLTAGFGDDAGRLADDAARNIKGACFAPGTLVLTDQGLRPIETLRIGDRVLSRDERTGETDWKEVRATFATPNAAVVRVTIASPDGSATELVVTPDHRFWTTTRGWRTAEELARGDRVATTGSQPLLVERVEPLRDRIRVHNLHVDQWETYFAGQESAWVHNMTCAAGGGGNQWRGPFGADKWTPRTLQTGGRTLRKGTVEALNEFGDVSLKPREWGRALEALKAESGLKPGHHGKILENGDYLDDAGELVGNLFDYLQ